MATLDGRDDIVHDNFFIPAIASIGGLVIVAAICFFCLGWCFNRKSMDARYARAAYPQYNASNAPNNFAGLNGQPYDAQQHGYGNVASKRYSKIQRKDSPSFIAKSAGSGTPPASPRPTIDPAMYAYSNVDKDMAAAGDNMRRASYQQQPTMPVYGFPGIGARPQYAGSSMSHPQNTQSISSHPQYPPSVASRLPNSSSAAQQYHGTSHPKQSAATQPPISQSYQQSELTYAPLDVPPALHTSNFPTHGAGPPFRTSVATSGGGSSTQIGSDGLSYLTDPAYANQLGNVHPNLPTHAEPWQQYASVTSNHSFNPSQQRKSTEKLPQNHDAPPYDPYSYDNPAMSNLPGNDAMWNAGSLAPPGVAPSAPSFTRPSNHLEQNSFYGGSVVSSDGSDRSPVIVGGGGWSGQPTVIEKEKKKKKSTKSK